MKKKNILYLLLVLALGFAAYFFITQKRSGTISERLKDFAVKDTAAITKIFIAGKNGSHITLDKVNNEWMVNNKYRARRDVMQVLLETIHRVEVQSPVPKAMLPLVMKNLATSATKVEIYTANGKIKTYYVGGATQDSYGTFMIMEGADKPFITHIPGFFGYLTIRYNTNEEVWRDHAVFRYDPSQIEIISVEYPGDKAGSFRLKIADDKYAQLVNLAGDTAKQNINGEFLRQYLDLYRGAYYEGLVKHLSKGMIDSLKRTNLYCIITVFDRSGNKNTAYLYKRYFRDGELVLDGGKKDLDTFRLFVLANNGREFTTAQYRTFGALTVKYNDFFGPPKPNRD